MHFHLWNHSSSMYLNTELPVKGRAETGKSVVVEMSFSAGLFSWASALARLKTCRPWGGGAGVTGRRCCCCCCWIFTEQKLRACSKAALSSSRSLEITGCTRLLCLLLGIPELWPSGGMWGLWTEGWVVLCKLCKDKSKVNEKAGDSWLLRRKLFL